MTFKSKLLSAITLLFALLINGRSWAQKTTEFPAPLNLAVIAPVVDCKSLVSADISPAVGSPTHISTAMPVLDGNPAPYCDVKGYVDPQVKFELRLPLTTWTQRFVQTGCGGLCGMLAIHLENDQGCLPAQKGELALTSTDMGHTGEMDARFGESDYRLRIDFAYRGVHVTTLAAKALIEKFYGQKPKYSYFTGCSDGGREALMEAQRYPDDFNGISAGAPAMNFVTQNTFYHGWNARMNTGVDGQPILTADKLPLLHKAVVARCDSEDGLKDGLISNPIGCDFDPEVLQCKAGQDPTACLTAAQVNVVKQIYAGAHDSVGNKLVLSGPLPGSELAWAGVYIPAPGSNRTMSPMISTGTLKFLAYEKNPPADYSLADLKFDRSSFTETTKLHALYDATDPDLSPFASAGGKLILWHGLADPHISPLNTIAYYTAVQQTMGHAVADRFLRLYLFPGGYHCNGGEGPFTVDLLSVMMAWVERGTAPGALIASHTPGNGTGPGAPPRESAAGPPPDRERPQSGTADRTRPIYPYPLTASYTGNGSIDDAKNFTEGKPEPIPGTELVWLGSSFYTPRYEEWCSANGTMMSCKPSR
jgi:Tannase and feruloyl esterase